MKKLTIVALATALIGASLPVLAAEGPAYDIIMGTGPKDKGYQLLGQDVLKVCGASLQIQNLETKGGADNLSRLAKGDIDVAFVQLDTLENAAKERPNYQEFRALASVNSNLLHGLTRKGGYVIEGESRMVSSWGGLKKDVVKGESRKVEVANMTDLKGFPVLAVGTAADVLNDLSKANGLNLNVIDRGPNGLPLTDADAMKLVAEGKAFVMFTVSSWPHGFLKEATPGNATLTTINYNLAPGAKQKIVTQDYEALGVRGAKFLGIPNLLISQGYEKGSDGYNNVVKFRTCVMGQWKNLRNTRGMHPGWKEASNPEDTHGWPKLVEGASPAKPKK